MFIPLVECYFYEAILHATSGANNRNQLWK